jgi:hypothetical protein
MNKKEAAMQGRKPVPKSTVCEIAEMGKIREKTYYKEVEIEKEKRAPKNCTEILGGNKGQICPIGAAGIGRGCEATDVNATFFPKLGFEFPWGPLDKMQMRSSEIWLERCRIFDGRAGRLFQARECLSPACDPQTYRSVGCLAAPLPPFVHVTHL